MTLSGNLNIFTVILAGGQGSRFWPISRMDRPKQFLSIDDSGESLITATAKRLAPLSDDTSQLVITNVRHEKLVKEHVPKARIITEPIAKNTAASIGLGALHVLKRDPNGVMGVFPADHYIPSASLLLERVKIAAQVAREQDVLVTIGITPSNPNTAYGYIQRGTEIADQVFQVNRFYEKPSLERAKNYLEQGGFFWNSGMFVWRASVLLDAIKSFMPQLYAGLMEIDAAIGTSQEEKIVKEVFEKLDSVSIDFGIMEHARNCVVIESGDIGWNDVGSWDAWANHFSTDRDNNLLHGDSIAIESKDCVVYSEKRLIAVVGCEDIVVIDSDEALLVCPRSHVQGVKKVVEVLKEEGREDLI